LTAATSTIEQTSTGSFPDFDAQKEEISTQSIMQTPPKQKKKKNAKRNSEAKREAKGVQEDWKQKVKTELCKFWLAGVDCENSGKDQGCGFAHGLRELQKKKGLNKQYLTSVCKNFIEDKSKCTYGQRCIFQHPSHDISVRQPYTIMLKDNKKYTAMRLF